MDIFSFLGWWQSKEWLLSCGCWSTKKWWPSNDCFHQKDFDCLRVGHCLDCDWPKDGDPRRYDDHSGDVDCPMNGDCECPGILIVLGMVTVHPRDGGHPRKGYRPKDGDSLGICLVYDVARPCIRWDLSTKPFYELTGTGRQADKPTYWEACTSKNHA